MAISSVFSLSSRTSIADLKSSFCNKSKLHVKNNKKNKETTDMRETRQHTQTIRKGPLTMIHLNIQCNNIYSMRGLFHSIAFNNYLTQVIYIENFSSKISSVFFTL